MELGGLHHVTAVSADIATNVQFFTDVLGLRLVKKSVNQDDTSAYHLFYADKLGTPGTDITFFDWPRIGPNAPGTDSIAGTVFRVRSHEALQFWHDRLSKHELKVEEITNFAVHSLLSFEDPEGQQLYLASDEGAEFEGEIWPQEDIPDEYAIRGFFSVLLSIPSFDQLDPIFKEILNFTLVEETTWIDKTTKARIYSTRPSIGPGSQVWLLEEPGASTARLGAGGTHHVAFRVADVDTQKKWRARILSSGLHVSQLIDRFWFNSIYFRVSRGILFEIATDGPGFEIDEELNSLGEKLVLPPFLEGRRQEIEAELTPIGN